MNAPIRIAAMWRERAPQPSLFSYRAYLRFVFSFWNFPLLPSLNFALLIHAKKTNMRNLGTYMKTHKLQQLYILSKYSVAERAF